MIPVTGGSSDIGQAPVERFLKEGHAVITCARDEERLKTVQARNPGLHILVCNMGKPEQ